MLAGMGSGGKWRPARAWELLALSPDLACSISSIWLPLNYILYHALVIW